MLPATFCAGMTLPLITRILYRNGANERAIGEVYAVNTAGSIIGVQLAGLLLLPLLGLKLLLIVAAALDVALGLVILYHAIPMVAARKRPIFAAATIAGILIVTGAWSAHFDHSPLQWSLSHRRDSTRRRVLHDVLPGRADRNRDGATERRRGT